MPQINSRKIETVLRSYLDRNEPKVRKVLVSTWNAQAEALKFEEITAALKTGRLSEAALERFAQIYARYINTEMKPILTDAGMSGYEYMRSHLSRITGFQFEATQAGQSIQRFIDKRSADFLTAVTQQQRDAVKTIVNYFAVREPVAPDELARYLRPVIRLSNRDTNAVINYRKQLKKSFPGMGDEQLFKNVNRYSQRLWRRRAETVARTELANAHNRGQYETVKAGIDSGAITRRVSKQFWTARDERVCPVCGPLHGEIIGFDDEFESSKNGPAVDSLTPPIHPRCRCTILYSMVNQPA